MATCPPAVEEGMDVDGVGEAIGAPERNATYVGCFAGVIETNLAAPTDVQRFERIDLGKRSRLDLRAPRAFRRCARACAGYPHAVMSVAPGDGTQGESEAVMKCLCSFGIETYLEVADAAGHEAPAKACEVSASGPKGPLGWESHGAVYSLPADPLEESGAEYAGCYGNYAEFEKTSAEFIEHFSVQSPPPSPPPPTVDNFEQRADALKRIRKAQAEAQARAQAQAGLGGAPPEFVSAPASVPATSAPVPAGARSLLKVNYRSVDYPSSPNSPPP